MEGGEKGGGVLRQTNASQNLMDGEGSRNSSSSSSSGRSHWLPLLLDSMVGHWMKRSSTDTHSKHSTVFNASYDAGMWV